jgi:hypothetical protein
MWGMFSRTVTERRIRALTRRLDRHHSPGYYTLLGAITAMWASVEMSLDAANYLIFKHADGDQIQSEMPVSLKPKIRFFRLAHERLAGLEAFRAEGAALISRVNALREKRHDMIHGFVLGVDPGGIHRLMRFSYEPQKFRPEYKQYSLDDLLTLSDNIADLAKDAANHANSLGRHFEPAEYTRDPIR